jgi:hypothetical protein
MFTTRRGLMLLQALRASDGCLKVDLWALIGVEAVP